MQKIIYNSLIDGLTEAYGSEPVRKWQSLLRALTAADGSSADITITDIGADATYRTRAGDVTICADLVTGRYWILKDGGPVECREYVKKSIGG